MAIKKKEETWRLIDRKEINAAEHKNKRKQSKKKSGVGVNRINFHKVN